MVNVAGANQVVADEKLNLIPVTKAMKVRITGERISHRKLEASGELIHADFDDDRFPAAVGFAAYANFNAVIHLP